MSPSQTIQSLLQEAIAALQSGRAETAREKARTAINAGANNATGWGVLALACRDLGDMPTALEAASQSLAHEPRNPRALVIKGDAYDTLGDRRAAAAFYREALQLGRSTQGASADIMADLARAEERCAALEQDFARHVERQIDDLMTDETEVSARMEHAVDLLLGRRRLYLPEPRHLYFPDLPNREFYDTEPFRAWLDVVENAFADIHAELQTLLADQADFSPYLTGVDNRPTYDTHGMKDNGDWGAFYLWHNGEPVLENQAKCPKTTAAMAQVPLVFSGARCPNVLFSKLKAGARIAPHHGMVNTRLIAHLPLIVPKDCGFRVGNDQREWQPGKVWLFDDTVEHEAWNNSDEDRVVLIFEVWKPELTAAEQQLATRLLEAVDDY